MVNTDISLGDDYPSGWRKANYSGVFSVEWILTMMFKFVHLLVFPPREQRIRMCVVWPEVYQKSLTTAFYDSTIPSSSINSPYVAGLSITYGSPRQHIWTYATESYDHLNQYNSETNFICPCANGVVRVDHLTLLMQG